MRVCHIVPSLEERHGGPSKSVRALANAQARSGFTVELLTTHEQPAAVATSATTAEVKVFQRDFPRRLCPSRGLRTYLKNAPCDLIHYHSLWLRLLGYAQETAQRRRLPLVLAPRGMMSDWAWHHHRWQKTIADRLLHPGALAGAAGWHATSQDEADDIRRRGFRQPICVAPNGVDLPVVGALPAARAYWHQLCPSTNGRPVALFYSRFHRKKRLRELVDLWAGAQTGDWLLLLAGLPEEYSVAEIEGWIQAAGAKSRIVVQDSTGHPPPYALASLFLLPTHSENFGLVVAEALAAGVPVLTTDTTPWHDLPRKGAGWCVSWPEFATTLTAALATPADTLAALGGCGRAWVAQDYTWERSARLLQDFYGQLPHV